METTTTISENNQNINKKQQPVMNVSEIKDIKSRIEDLNDTESLEVLKIIQSDSINYSENKNGIFVNMTKLQNETLLKLSDFVNFCHQNKKSLEEDESNREIFANTVEKNKNKNNKKKSSDTMINVDNDNNSLSESMCAWDGDEVETINGKSNSPTFEFDKNEKSSIEFPFCQSQNNLTINKSRPSYNGTEARIIKKSIK